MTELHDLLAVAQEATAIGALLMTGSAPGTVSEKGDRDLVTSLDVRIQREVRAHLRRVTPGIGFLGEEDGGGTLDENAAQVWVLDPIDGTSNFVHGLPFCATSLALVRRGEPVVGVIAAPLLDLRYQAVRGDGACRNGETITASAATGLERAMVSVDDYATGPGAGEWNQRHVGMTRTLAERVERIRMFGSAALDLAMVAEGRTEACVIVAGQPWDIAAGVLIAEEAGAKVTDLTGAPGRLTSSGILAAAPGLHAPLLPLVAERRE